MILSELETFFKQVLFCQMKKIDIAQKIAIYFFGRNLSTTAFQFL